MMPSAAIVSPRVFLRQQCDRGVEDRGDDSGDDRGESGERNRGLISANFAGKAR
jgi:hypothetical protein